MPIDVVKVRLQMQGADGTRQYKGLVDATLKTAQKEGLPALWKGLAPALVRQVSQWVRSGLPAVLSCSWSTYKETQRC